MKNTTPSLKILAKGILIHNYRKSPSMQVNAVISSVWLCARDIQEESLFLQYWIKSRPCCQLPTCLIWDYLVRRCW